MSFANNLIAAWKAGNVVNESWNTFCGDLDKVADTIRKLEREGEAVEVIVNALSMGGIPAEVISQMTNEKLASLINASASTMREGGAEKNYLFGLFNERGTLDLYLFNSTNGKTESVSAPIPNYGTELAAQMMVSAWIKLNMERYAEQRNAIVLPEVTNFMCGINY